MIYAGGVLLRLDVRLRAGLYGYSGPPLLTLLLLPLKPWLRVKRVLPTFMQR